MISIDPMLWVGVALVIVVFSFTIFCFKNDW